MFSTNHANKPIAAALANPKLGGDAGCREVQVESDVL